MRVAPMTSRFLDACRRRPTDVRPVWFMRQAGRYLKQYRHIRERHSILEMCKRPDLASTVTLQPVELLDVDAAIIFADLLLPVEPMGLKLRYATGEGPIIDNPVRTTDDVDSSRPPIPTISATSANPSSRWSAPWPAACPSSASWARPSPWPVT